MRRAQKCEKLSIANENKNAGNGVYEISEADMHRLRAFEDALVSSIEAAEETLQTVKNRHAIYARIMQRIELAESQGIREDHGVQKSKFSN